jgi:hypothetical protein
VNRKLWAACLMFSLVACRQTYNGAEVHGAVLACEDRNGVDWITPVEIQCNDSTRIQWPAVERKQRKRE